MIGWQIDDMYFEKNYYELNLEHLIRLHNKKTWALIKISIIWWILLSNNKKNYEKYKEFWEKIGLAFQIKDDLLDVEGNFEETWKSVWWEQKWFIFFMWIEKTKEYLKNLINDSLKIISELKSEKLDFLVNYIWNRKK